MPKKSKKSTHTSVVSNSIKDTKADEEDLIAQDPQFYRGSSKFKFPNGDEYEGEFCAHASGLVWRQGKGTYVTNEGHIYLGEWIGDKLDESKEVEITYIDGTKYIGNLQGNKYSGSGLIKLEERISLMTNFVENKPSNDVILLDPNGKTWHGFAEQDECLLIPEHAFYRSIGKDLGKGRPRQQSLPTNRASVNNSDTSSSKSLKYSDIRDVEKQVFAKTKKTPSNLQLDSSEWYQEYVDYKKTYGDIVCKAKNTGEMSLTAEEYGWYIHYKEFEKKYMALMNNFKNKIRNKGPSPDKLFKMLYSEEEKTKNKPVPVFYPHEAKSDCNSNCEC